MSRSRRDPSGPPDPGPPADTFPRSLPWLVVVIVQALGSAFRRMGTEWDWESSWLVIVITAVLACLIVTVVLALRAASRRRAPNHSEPEPPWLSPMYDPWLDG